MPDSAFKRTYINWPADRLTGGAQFVLNCECSQHYVPQEWIAAQIAAGRQRVVFSD